MDDTDTTATATDSVPVLRVYDVGNASGNGFWCLAFDEKDAAELAFELKHVKDPANARVHDVHTRMLTRERAADIEAFIAMGERGQLALRMEPITGPPGQVTASQWVLRTPTGFVDPLGNRAEFGYELPVPW